MMPNNAAGKLLRRMGIRDSCTGSGHPLGTGPLRQQPIRTMLWKWHWRTPSAAVLRPPIDVATCSRSAAGSWRTGPSSARSQPVGARLSRCGACREQQENHDPGVAALHELFKSFMSYTAKNGLGIADRKMDESEGGRLVQRAIERFAGAAEPVRPMSNKPRRERSERA